MPYNKDRKFGGPRRSFNGQPFKDLDEPEGVAEGPVSTSTAGAINYLEI